MTPFLTLVFSIFSSGTLRNCGGATVCLGCAACCGDAASDTTGGCGARDTLAGVQLIREAMNKTGKIRLMISSALLDVKACIYRIPSLAKISRTYQVIAENFTQKKAEGSTEEPS